MASKKKNYNKLITTLNYIENVNKQNVTQVTKETQKKRVKALTVAFSATGENQFKYLNEAIASGNNEKINEEVKRALKTMASKLKREIYKPVKNKQDSRISRGVAIPKYLYDQLTDLEKEFNTHKKELYEEFLKENPNLSKVEKDFLQGVRVKNINGAEEIQLPLSFAEEDFFGQIRKDTKIPYFLERKEKQFLKFGTKVGQYSNTRFNNHLEGWIEENKLNDDQRDLVIAKFNQLQLHKKYNFNQELNRLMAWVESIVTNPKSRLGYYEALMEVVLKQDDYIFDKSGY